MSGPSRQRLFDRFAPMVIGLLVLPAVGVAGYCWIEGWPVLDALYMTVTTLATVGFSEVHPLSPAGRIFTMALIVSGGVIAAYAVTQVAQIMFSGFAVAARADLAFRFERKGDAMPNRLAFTSLRSLR